MIAIRKNKLGYMNKEYVKMDTSIYAELQKTEEEGEQYLDLITSLQEQLAKAEAAILTCYRKEKKIKQVISQQNT